MCMRVCERACVVACECTRTLVAASISAPFSISTRTASTCPCSLATISDVRPSWPASRQACAGQGRRQRRKRGCMRGCMHVCPCIMCEIKQDHVCVFMCSPESD